MLKLRQEEHKEYLRERSMERKEEAKRLKKKQKKSKTKHSYYDIGSKSQFIY